MVDGKRSAPGSRNQDSGALLSFLPWLRRRTHMRLLIEQGEAYRREIQEARWDAERARADLGRFVDSLAPTILTAKPFPEGNLRIVVEVERRLLVREPQAELLALVRDSVMRRLVNLDHDYRGDLRQTPTQRALGL